MQDSLDTQTSPGHDGASNDIEKKDTGGHRDSSLQNHAAVTVHQGHQHYSSMTVSGTDDQHLYASMQDSSPMESDARTYAQRMAAAVGHMQDGNAHAAADSPMPSAEARGESKYSSFGSTSQPASNTTAPPPPPPPPTRSPSYPGSSGDLGASDPSMHSNSRDQSMQSYSGTGAGPGVALSPRNRLPAGDGLEPSWPSGTGPSSGLNKVTERAATSPRTYVSNSQIQPVDFCLPRQVSLCAYSVLNKCRYGTRCLRYHPSLQEIDSARERTVVRMQHKASMNNGDSADAAAAVNGGRPLGPPSSSNNAPAISTATAAAAAPRRPPAPETLDRAGVVAGAAFKAAAQAAVAARIDLLRPVPKAPSRVDPGPQMSDLGSRILDLDEVPEESKLTFRNDRGQLMVVDHDRAYPVRPGGEVCQHFSMSGDCKFREKCRYHHSPTRASAFAAGLGFQRQSKPSDATVQGWRQAPAGALAGPPVSASATAVGGKAAGSNGDRPVEYTGNESSVAEPHSLAKALSAAAAAAAAALPVVGGPAAEPRCSIVAPVVITSATGRQGIEIGGKKMPLRLGSTPCRNLAERGICLFGAKCVYSHTPEMYVAWARKATRQSHKTAQPAQQEVGVEARGVLCGYRAAFGPQEDNLPVVLSIGNANMRTATRITGNAVAAAATALDKPARAGAAADAAAAPARFSVSQLLEAVDRIWVDQSSAQRWALAQSARYLVTRAAWEAEQGRGNVSARDAPRTMVDTLDLSTRLGSAVIGQHELSKGAQVLSKMGAELGLMWRKVRRPGAAVHQEYGVKIGPLIRTDQVGQVVFEARSAAPPTVWVNLRLEGLMKLGGLQARAVEQQVVAEETPIRSAPGTLLPEGIMKMGALQDRAVEQQVVAEEMLVGRAPATEAAAQGGSAATAAAAAPIAGEGAGALDGGAAGPTAAAAAVAAAAAAALTASSSRPSAAASSWLPEQGALHPELYELLVTGDDWKTELRLAAAGQLDPAGGVSPVAGEAGAAWGHRDDAVWDLLALLPRWLATLVEPYCWQQPAGGGGLTGPARPGMPAPLACVTIAAGETPVLRFRGGGRVVLKPDPASMRQDPLAEALARLACSSVLLGALQQGGSVRAGGRTAWSERMAGGSEQAGGLPGDEWCYDASALFSDALEGVEAMLVPGTLHRAVVTRDAYGSIASLTYRIGRQPGSDRLGHPGPSPALMLADVLREVLAGGPAQQLGAAAARLALAPGTCPAVSSASQPGLLILGPPGSGKTTLLRALTQAAALHMDKTVVVLDNSWEIGGMPLSHSDGPAAQSLSMADLGPGTQRTCLHHLVTQHQAAGSSPAAIVHAVAGALAALYPDVVVMDDLMSELDVGIARLLSARGIVVLAAAHARDLPSLLHNNDLCGTCGIMDLEASAAAAAAAVAVASASELRECSMAAAHVPLQRVGLPGFSCLVELAAGPSTAAAGSASGSMRVYPDLGRSVGEMVCGLSVSSPASEAGVVHPTALDRHSHLRFFSPCGNRVVVQTF